MKIPVNAKTLNADLISLSGHKIHGPKGVGAIYIKKGIRINAIINGGGQEKNIRSGTENVPLIAGLKVAVEEFMDTINDRYKYISELKSYFTEKIADNDNIVILSKETASPYIVAFAVKGIKSEVMLHYLEQKEIYISSGSSCSKGKKSEVLKAFNVDENLLDFVVRMSFSYENTKADIDKFIDAIKESEKSLQKIKLR